MIIFKSMDACVVRMNYFNYDPIPKIEYIPNMEMKSSFAQIWLSLKIHTEVHIQCIFAGRHISHALHAVLGVSQLNAWAIGRNGDGGGDDNDDDDDDDSD